MPMFDDIIARRSAEPQETEILPATGMFSDIIARRDTEPQRGMFEDIIARRGEQPIGFGEAFVEKPLEKLPFSPMAVANVGALITAGMRLQEDNYDLAAERVTTGAQVARGGFFPGYAKVPEITPESLRQTDTDLLTDYFEDLAEKERRGYSIMGRVGQITSMMPGFMVDFLATGGVAKLGTKGAQKIAESILKRSARKGMERFVVGSAKFAASAGARALAMPFRGAEAILKRRMPKGITFDELGEVHITKPDEKVWTSIWKGALDHYIEIASEQAGEVMGPALAKAFNASVGKLPFFGKLTGALQNAWLGKNPTKHAADFLKAVGTKTGFHGVITEIGEERLGTIARAILNVEDYGAGKDSSIGDRLKAGWEQDKANLPAELIAFSIPGVGRAAIAHSFQSPTDMYNVVSVDKKTGKVVGIASNHNNLISAYKAGQAAVKVVGQYATVEFEIREPGEAPETSRYGKSRESAKTFYDTAVRERKARQLRELETGEVEPLRNYIVTETDSEGNVYEESFETREAAELHKQGAEAEGSTVKIMDLVPEFVPEIKPEVAPPSDVPMIREIAGGILDYESGTPQGIEPVSGETAEEREKIYGVYEDMSNINKRGMSKERTEDLGEALSKNLSKENPDLNLSRGWFRDKVKKVKKGIKVYHHSMSRVLQTLKHLDGGFEGPLVNAIYRPIKTAAFKSHVARGNLGSEIQSWLSDNKIPWIKMLRATEKITEKDKVTGKETVYKISSFQKVQIYLNTLNEDNLRHLQNTLSQENIDNLSKLNETEQKVADWLLEQYAAGYQDTADIYSKATGKDLGLVDNYVHIDVDKNFIDFRNDVEEEQVTRRTFMPRDVEKGATKKRVKSDAPLRLNDAISAFVLHEQNRRHYVAMELNAKDVKDIINEPKLAQRLNVTTGVNYKKILNKWLTDTATQSNQEINNWFNKFMNGMRRNYVTYALGFNLVTMMRQPVSFSLAVAKDPLILANLIKGISFTADKPTLYPGEAIQLEHTPFERSKMLKARFVERELREMELLKSPVKSLSKDLKAYQLPLSFLTHPVETWKGLDIRELSFRHIRAADRTTVSLVFKAAYRSGRQRGMSPDSAIAYADSVIETTQPMAGLEDLPDIYRGGTFAKVFTAFQNQINQNYNFWAYDVIGAKRGKRIDSTELAWRVFAGHVLPAFLMGAIARGKLPWDEEFLRDWKARLTDQAGYLVVPLYFFGTIVRNMIEGFGGRQTLPLQVYDDIDDAIKGKTPERKLKGLTRAVGKGVGLPINQAIRTTEGIYDWTEQKHEDWKRLIWSKYMLEEKEEPGVLMRRVKRPSGRGAGRAAGRTR